MMTIEQVLERFKVDSQASSGTFDADSLTRETRMGTQLARALIGHICSVRAAGYDNEIMVDGEAWVVQVRRKTPFS